MGDVRLRTDLPCLTVLHQECIQGVGIPMGNIEGDPPAVGDGCQTSVKGGPQLVERSGQRTQEIEQVSAPRLFRSRGHAVVGAGPAAQGTQFAHLAIVQKAAQDRIAFLIQLGCDVRAIQTGDETTVNVHVRCSSSRFMRVLRAAAVRACVRHPSDSPKARRCGAPHGGRGWRRRGDWLRKPEPLRARISARRCVQRPVRS